MKKSFFQRVVNVMACAFVLIASVELFTSCDNLLVNDDSDDDVVVVDKGYGYEGTLTHQWDSVYRVKITDYMTSHLTVWRTVGNDKNEVYNNKVNLLMEAHSELAREDYAITEAQVNIKATNTTIARDSLREKDGTVSEVDTIRHYFPDGQIKSIPVKITNTQVELGSNVVFKHPSLTLVSAEFAYLKNSDKAAMTRAVYKSAEYNTEYKTWLTLKETNVSSPKTFKVAIYAYTDRYVLSEDDIDHIEAENKTRVWVDTLTERCSFDKVTYYKSGEQTRENKEIILQHKFEGIAPYDKTVQNFNHALTGSNGVADGTESWNRDEDNWKVWRKTDKYSANVENGVADDKILTDYSLMHERCIYKDEAIEVEFPYETIDVQEISTSVSGVTSDKPGFAKAIENNRIGVRYLNNSQSLNELVYLYMGKKEISGYEVANQKIQILKDSVIADLDFVTKYTDGTTSKEHDHFSAPRSLVVNTNWESIQEILSQVTDSVATVNMVSKTAAEKGYWKYNNETRNISVYVQLYDGTQKLNGWTSIVPNGVQYVRDGYTYTFTSFDYVIRQKGAAFQLRGEEDGYTVYDYSDNIEENFGEYIQSSKAPGVLKIANSKVKGFEIRNKQLTVLNDKVIASLDFVTMFANGTESTDKVSKEFPRSLVCTSDWLANEANSYETTSQPTSKLMASQSKSDDEWAWVEETRSITANVALAGSTQFNNWTAVDANKIKFNRNGQSADFGNISHSVVMVSHNTTLLSSDAISETHQYSNTISVNYGDNMQSSTAPGTINVQKAKEVIGHEFRTPSLVINNDNVIASLIYVTKYNDGTEDTENVSRTFPRTLNCLTDWTANADNSSVVTSNAYTDMSGRMVITDGNWSYASETRTINTMAQLVGGGNQRNIWEANDPNQIVYSRDGERYEFGYVKFTATEAGQNINLASETTTLSTYRYTDLLNVTFGDNSQSILAPGTINVAKEKTVVGYEITNPNLTVNQNNVEAQLTFVTKWSDGTETTESVSKLFARNFQVLTNWSSNEANANQSTSSASTTVSNSVNQTDGDWSYVSETRNINTTANLNGSSQKNGWQSVDPNNITFSRNGQSYNFGSLSFNATETGANVKQTSDTDEATIYSYTDNISVAFGNHTFASSAPGKITVAKENWTPDFPASWGHVTGCTVTTAKNESRNTWVYVASVHFKNGTLPIIIRKEASTPEVNFDYFESDTNPELNSGTYIVSWKKWINTIASDTPDMMQWSTSDNRNADNLAYPTATAWGWDYGHTVNGHSSVFTDRYHAEVSSNGALLTIYKGNTVFAQYKAAKQ